MLLASEWRRHPVPKKAITETVKGIGKSPLSFEEKTLLTTSGDFNERFFEERFLQEFLS